jgi:hypothetical protein
MQSFRMLCIWESQVKATDFIEMPWKIWNMSGIKSIGIEGASSSEKPNKIWPLCIQHRQEWCKRISIDWCGKRIKYHFFGSVEALLNLLHGLIEVDFELFVKNYSANNTSCVFALTPDIASACRFCCRMKEWPGKFLKMPRIQVSCISGCLAWQAF